MSILGFRKKIFLLMLCCLFVLMPYSSHEEFFSFSDSKINVAYVKITSYSEFPNFVSGVFASFIIVRVKKTSGQKDEFYIPYMKKLIRADLPKVGRKAYLIYEFHDVKGILGNKSGEVKDAKVVKWLVSCE